MSSKKYMNDYKRWLEFEGLDAALKNELVLIEGDEKAIAERFAAELEFGTGGMRGILGAGIGRMNIYTVMRVSRAFAEYIKSLGVDSAEKGVVISAGHRSLQPKYRQTAPQSQRRT